MYANKQTNGHSNENTHVAAGKSMNTLRRFLCDVVRMEKHTEKVVCICRNCEAQCAYGREYVRRYDAGERPVKMGPKPKLKEKDLMENMGKPTCTPEQVIAQLERELADMRGREEAARDTIKHLRTQLEEQEAKLTEAHKQIDMDSKLIESARVQLEASDKGLKSQENELLDLREEKCRLTDECRKLAKTAAEREQLNDDLQKTISMMHERTMAQQQELEVLKEAYRQSEEKRHADRLTAIRLKARLWDMEHPDMEDV